MAVDRNLVELYQHAFGQVAIPWPIKPPVDRVEIKANDYFDIPQSQFELQSMLGTPIFQPVTLEDVLLPNEPIVEIRCAKRIVRTDIDGMDGTFKELFSMDDYGVTIRGIITQEDGSDNWPEDTVRQIRALFERKSALRITNTMANLFGIHLLAIDSIEFPVIEGSNGVQPYIIQGMSDKILDIELRNG